MHHTQNCRLRCSSCARCVCALSISSAVIALRPSFLDAFATIESASHTMARQVAFFANGSSNPICWDVSAAHIISSILLAGVRLFLLSRFIRFIFILYAHFMAAKIATSIYRSTVTATVAIARGLFTFLCCLFFVEFSFWP